MQSLKRISLLVVAAIVCASAVTTVAQTQTNGGAAVQQIDTECNAISEAVMALHPIHVVLRSATWAVISDADYAAAGQTQANVTYADVYKQGPKYAWVHAHSFDAQGKQSATQLCYRQSDGTLERARQASDVPGLSQASAEQAYFSPDGKVIQSTKLFEKNDPMLAKTVESLPFYSVLPK
jgi:hypothetical protein